MHSNELTCWQQSILLIGFPYVIFLALNAATGVDAKWPTAYQEHLDEINDLQLFKAVKQSMTAWERSHKHHRKKRAEKSVCYGELGCFEDSGPFGYLDMLPASPEEINTRFFFYSTKNRSDRPLLELPYLEMGDAWRELRGNGDTPDAENLTTTEQPTMYDSTTGGPSKNWLSLRSFEGLDHMSIRVIVHGFGAACRHVWIYEMRTALMAVEDCIVICVDWEAGANLPNYVKAAANTRLVGKQLAMLLKGLQDFKGLELSRVHLIGFSLGAHVSGFAGSDLPGLKRITGLDPAGPLFEAQHPKARLDSSDANFVDVIHSNGENLILGGLGSWQPMGDVDFYPNGGRVQTGCSNLFVGALTDFIWSPSAVVEGRSLCNHRRAYKFFIDSVAPRCLFPAFPCSSYDEFLKGECFPCEENEGEAFGDSRCGNMGYYADKSTGRGQLYLVTREEEPFCAHQFHIEIYTSESDLPLRTIGKIEATLEGDGALNETFSITDKDDTELFAGDVISRILVPHPALGFPQGITLTYKTYSGWLSKGLPHWTIHKIILTDSFGKSYSMCKNYMLLESGLPVRITLQPGICYVTDENDITYNPFDEETATDKLDNVKTSSQYRYTTVSPFSNGDDVDKLREKKNVINLGTSFKITQNKTYSFMEKTENLPWQPILDSVNSVERNSIESSRSFPSNNHAEIFEPILKDRQKQIETGRSIQVNSNGDRAPVYTEEEIMEPVLRSTTTKNRKTKQFLLENSTMRPRDNSFFTVQLLPFRLGELFERAEKYARETLLPLISEQAPRFFGFGIGRDESYERKPKYIPSFAKLMRNETAVSLRKLDLPPILNKTVFVIDNPSEQITDKVNATDSRAFADRSFSISEDDRPVDYGRGNKNILSLLRSKDAPVAESATSEGRALSAAGVSNPYYTNPDAIKTDDNLKVVRIELPTYKPPVRKPYFPYQFDIPTASKRSDNIHVIPLSKRKTTVNTNENKKIVD